MPIFIVFGFFNYYNTYVKVYLIGGNEEVIDKTESTRAMNLTKVLFIGSIISYVLIKIIEEIFEPIASVNSSWRIIKLSAGGLLVLMLMIYFIFLDKLNHTEAKRQREE